MQMQEKAIELRVGHMLALERMPSHDVEALEDDERLLTIA